MTVCAMPGAEKEGPDVEPGLIEKEGLLGGHPNRCEAT